nr:MAG TPA: hypothetical protein [Caudoviricetes sp.]
MRHKAFQTIASSASAYWETRRFTSATKSGFRSHL